MTWDLQRTTNGVQVWDADGTTRYKDASTGKFLDADEARRRLRPISPPPKPPEPEYDFSRSDLGPIEYWPRRVEWKTVVGQPIEGVNWSLLTSELRDIWDENDDEFTHFYAGITAVVSDSAGEGFETELKTLTLDTRRPEWPMSLYGDFNGKLELLFQWADDYDSVFIVNVRTVGKVHANA